MSEYSVLCKVLELAVFFDLLKVSNLACLKLIARRLQLIEEKYRFRMPQMEGEGKSADPEQVHSIFMALPRSFRLIIPFSFCLKRCAHIPYAAPRHDGANRIVSHAEQDRPHANASFLRFEDSSSLRRTLQAPHLHP